MSPRKMIKLDEETEQTISDFLFVMHDLYKKQHGTTESEVHLALDNVKRRFQALMLTSAEANYLFMQKCVAQDSTPEGLFNKIALLREVGQSEQAEAQESNR